MLDNISALALQAAHSAWEALRVLLWPAVFFALLALIVKRGRAIPEARRALSQSRINLELILLDAIFVTPLIVLLITAEKDLIHSLGLMTALGKIWETLGVPATLLIAVFFGDFVAYWRHRLEHSAALWPAHAVHHSDNQMTWLTLARFHPVNRAATAGIDNLFLILAGFPDWALIANNLIRHYYGHFIHADLPWSYGYLGRIFVSPVMHRWHHIRDVDGSGYNFATVFSVFDRSFGTFHAPHPCDVPLGVREDMGQGSLGQLWHPFKIWLRLDKAQEPREAG